MVPKKWMTHLNGHVMCAIDCETTGLDPEQHMLYQIAILPLDARLLPREDVVPFDVYIKPDQECIERIVWGDLPKGSQKRIAHALENGFDPFIAADLFEEWYKQLELHENKRITPLGHNYIAFDKLHITRWLGWHHYNHYFDSRARDTIQAACFMNDYAEFNANAIPFTDMTLARLCTALGVKEEAEQFHDAVFDAMMTARCYKKMCKEVFV